MKILLAIFLLFAAASSAQQLRYAKNFSVEELGTHKLLTVRNTWLGAGDQNQVYALVPRKSQLPELANTTVVVRTPVQRAVVMSTVYLGPVDDLDLYDSLVGIAHVGYANNERAHQLVSSGQVKEVQTGSALDVESMLMLRPDLILTSTSGNPTFDVNPLMRRAGLPVVVTAGYMESHPLARAEWIKFYAAFYGKDEQAKVIFDQIANRYESLVQLVDSVDDRPTVFINAPFSGVWRVSGGQSYIGTALRHAGADYLWSDLNSPGSRPMDIEVILNRASEADIWLNPSHYASLKELLAADQRFVGFKALREGSVYNKTLRVNAAGGNDIYERGVSHPEEVLADLIAIFHTELLPGHEFVYYERLK